MNKASEYVENERQLDKLLNDSYEDVKPLFHQKFSVQEYLKCEDS